MSIISKGKTLEMIVHNLLFITKELCAIPPMTEVMGILAEFFMNKYDKFMLQIIQKISDNLGNNFSDRYYLIGITKFDDTFDHELTHALYSCYDSYREECDKLILNLDYDLKTHITDYLSSIGYAPEVFDDEIQAYLSTGYDSIYREASLTRRYFLKHYLKKASKPFVDLYNQHKLISYSFEEVD